MKRPAGLRVTFNLGKSTKAKASPKKARPKVLKSILKTSQGQKQAPKPSPSPKVTSRPAASMPMGMPRGEFALGKPQTKPTVSLEEKTPSLSSQARKSLGLPAPIKNEDQPVAVKATHDLADADGAIFGQTFGAGDPLASRKELEKADTKTRDREYGTFKRAMISKKND